MGFFTVILEHSMWPYSTIVTLQYLPHCLLSCHFWLGSICSSEWSFGILQEHRPLPWLDRWRECLPFPITTNCIHPQGGWNPLSPSALCDRVLTVLLPCTPCAGDHSCSPSKCDATHAWKSAFHTALPSSDSDVLSAAAPVSLHGEDTDASFLHQQYCL